MWENESRVNKRYHSIARVSIEGIQNTDIMLKNISITGCCVNCLSVVDLSVNSQYKIKIKPESNSKIGNFDLPVECKWICCTNNSSEVGFSIVGLPEGKLFQRYVDYLSFRSKFDKS